MSDNEIAPEVAPAEIPAPEVAPEGALESPDVNVTVEEKPLWQRLSEGLEKSPRLNSSDLSRPAEEYTVAEFASSAFPEEDRVSLDEKGNVVIKAGR